MWPVRWQWSFKVASVALLIRGCRGCEGGYCSSLPQISSATGTSCSMVLSGRTPSSHLLDFNRNISRNGMSWGVHSDCCQMRKGLLFARNGSPLEDRVLEGAGGSAWDVAWLLFFLSFFLSSWAPSQDSRIVTWAKGRPLTNWSAWILMLGCAQAAPTFSSLQTC